MDHNELASKQEFPLMNSLNTLWVNNNKIESLEVFLECIKDKFPNLTYLSMLKNPCCPNYFIGKDSNSYQRYRNRVLASLPKLKFLDASPITEQERKEGLALAKSMIRIDTTSKKEETEEENVVEDETITETNITEEPVTKTTFGVTKYVYFGRQSEGNRFIADHQL